MGNLKKQALDKVSEDIQTHELTEREFNYTRLLNVALQYHTMGKDIISGFLFYVCTSRLGYIEGANLQFELDLDGKDRLLVVKMMPSTE